MKRQIISLIAFLAIGSSLLAQDPVVIENAENKEKKTSHYFSLQLNELIRNIINLSASEEVITNPYVLQYQFNSNYTGWGGNFGLGYTIEEKEDGDALLSTYTKVNQLDFRAGVERKKHWGRKWLGSLGLDGLYHNASNVTVSQSTNGFGQILQVENDERNESFGGGPRGSLHFKLSPRVLIGTEASFYFTITKSTTKVTQSQNGNITNSDESSPTRKNLVFLGPRSLLLTITF